MTVELLNESGVAVDESEMSRLCRFVLDRMRLHPQTEVCLRLVDEETMANYNTRWMGADGPTDVLAFPMDELRPGRLDEDLPEGILGDLLLCPAVASAQAAEHGHAAADEMHLLVVHGLLHLLGYDHDAPQDHREMFDLQARLLAEWQGVRAGEDVEA